MSTKPRGYVVYEGKSRLTGDPIVAVITLKSMNAKTGNMGQLWILDGTYLPTEAAANGHDKSVCGMCKYRPFLKDQRINKEKKCYVTLIHGPNQIWKGWKAGNYPPLPNVRGFRFSDPVRFGAYGDPAALPLPVLKKLVARCTKGWTGYTHQWKQPKFRGLKSLVMASVDNEPEQALAVSDGWRTFRVMQENDDFPRPLVSKHFGFTSDGRRQEIICPGGAHTHNGVDYATGEHSTCRKCLLCDGKGANDRRKNIAVHAH